MPKKKIYTVATSHLDTVWSWDFETTVSQYIYNTLVDNFKLFEKYPSYKFSFEGSYRYELMEEYYPCLLYTSFAAGLFDATIPDDDKEITDFIQHDEDNAEEKAE